ncbi:DUF2267 domain-containing protein [Actinopolymorpha sp. B11F2]|uniref:DUF2267 domain-containing protein n=1 Tax=Actinopolymorpha sp. B11F2 TaxID=3160862 RepID=UPI0032E4500B
MTLRPHALEHAERTAHEWLATIGRHLGTQDLDFTFRVVRAWLHTVRDRLPVEGAAHLAAQLPEVLRGVFYDGWAPSRVPIRIAAGECTARFAQEARISTAEVPDVASTVSSGLGEMFSPGLLETAFAQMPDQLATLFRPAPGVRPARGGEASAAGDETGSEHVRTAGQTDDRQDGLERLERLERDVRALTDAVSALASGLEHVPPPEPPGESAAKAARRAHQLLPSARTPE